MKILFVASELTPIAKVGGLGDVMGALPKALTHIGVEAGMVLPFYGFIPRKGARRIAHNIIVRLGNSEEVISLYETVIPNTTTPLFLVENKRYWTHGPEPYFEQTGFTGAKDEIQRFTFFSRAVFELIKLGYLKADILHCQDWHTGALASYIARFRGELENPKIKTIFTIHNLSNQGKWNKADIDFWLFGSNEEPFFNAFGKDYNFIAEGILTADYVTTVSPTYALEIQTKEYGAGLEKVIQKRSDRLVGILNGIDYAFFNPATDPLIEQRYSYDSLNLKRVNTTAFRESSHFDDTGGPLFGFVARLTAQKSIDLIIDALESLLPKLNAQFTFLGSGAKEYEDHLIQLAKNFPNHIRVKIGFDEALAHRIYAASDFFFMPSRFEPCGLGQMISMRYGSVPIVRATGGLKDSVEHRKTGFVFTDSSVSALKKEILAAHELYMKKPKDLQKMQENGMRKNFDFENVARAYKDLYQKVSAL
ncbi:MAG: glycogen/starch synthase [Patescibacteria group bacterium]